MDEQVGKVAQVTPFLIAKALECFLGALVEKTVAVCVEKGSKKVFNSHF